MTPVSTRTASRSIRRIFPYVIFLVALFGRPLAARAETLTGRIVDPDGRPVATAKVLVDGPLGTRTVHADADGRFEISLDDRSTYRLLVQAAGFLADPIAVRANDHPAPLTTTPRVAPTSEAGRGRGGGAP